MTRKLSVLVAVLALLGGLAFAQDLKIDYNLDLNAGSKTSYFTFTGPIRYMVADKDHLDATSGASVGSSTELFNAYLYDVKGKVALSSGLRGLFLYAVGAAEERDADNLSISKAADGTITINYAHRGTAYQLQTDKSGKLAFPTGVIRKRAIGFIVGEGPQVIGKDFSSDGTPSKIDWAKVWDGKIAAGKEVAAGNAAKTGAIASDAADPASMYYWDGALQLSFDNKVLKISGGLNAVKR